MKTFSRSFIVIIITTISMGFILSVLTQFNLIVQAAPANELDVCATCAYATIQTAVNAANPGDTIRVAEGTYQDVVTATGLLTTTVLITKDLTLIGGFSPDFQVYDPAAYPTIIDGQNSAKGIYVFGVNAHIEGFIIVNGLNQGILVRVDFNNNPASATIFNNHIHDNPGSGIVFYQAQGEVRSNRLASNEWEGIALLEATATITNNTIIHNNLHGIYVGNSMVTIVNNDILSNTAEDGGGLTLDDLTQFTVTHNTIANNQAQLYGGGGIAIFDGATGTITFNEVTDNQSGACCGGGVSAYANGNLTFSNNTITGNYSQNGAGGLDFNPDDNTFNTVTFITITNNLIQENVGDYGSGIALNNVNGGIHIAANDIRLNTMVAGTPDYQAGGIHIWGSSGPIELVNNVFAENANRALKVANFSELGVFNNTIVGNGAMGIETFAWPVTPTEPYTASVMNNIIVGHAECGVSGFNGIVMFVDYNLFHTNDTDICLTPAAPPYANVFADPQFVSSATGDYHLRGISPAIDSGVASPNIPTIDIEGNGRPQGNGVDMGAYEATRYALFLPVTVKPPPSLPDNFTIVNREFGQGYTAYSGDVHVWVSGNDGWGFAPQDPDNVTFHRWNGTKWNSFQTLPSGGWYFLGSDLKMLSATEGWAVAPRTGQGPSTFFRWNGTQWTEGLSINAGITAMDFRNSNEGWAVGYPPYCCGSLFFHWDGSSWTQQVYLQLNWPVADIVLVNNGDGWAVGSTIARQSSNNWVVYGNPVAESLNAISMVSADDGWIVGDAGTILHWNGTTWSQVTSPTTEDLRDIEMVQSNHGWAVGKNGTILRWNGTSWSLVASPVNADFSEVDMTDINEGWIPYHDTGTSTYGVLQITAP